MQKPHSATNKPMENLDCRLSDTDVTQSSGLSDQQQYIITCVHMNRKFSSSLCLKRLYAAAILCRSCSLAGQRPALNVCVVHEGCRSLGKVVDKTIKFVLMKTQCIDMLPHSAWYAPGVLMVSFQCTELL